MLKTNWLKKQCPNTYLHSVSMKQWNRQTVNNNWRLIEIVESKKHQNGLLSKEQTKKQLYWPTERMKQGPNAIKKISCLILCYTSFKQNDWLLKNFQPIRMLNTSVA